EGVDARLIEAARTLGAGRWRAFVDVELPMAVTGLLVAFALCFGLSVSETTATLMLARPEQVTMPVSVYRFLAARDFPSASAMAVLLMAVTGGVFLLGELLAALLRRQRGGRAVTRSAWSRKAARPEAGGPPAGGGATACEVVWRRPGSGGRQPHGRRRGALGRRGPFGVRQGDAAAAPWRVGPTRRGEHHH